MWKMRIKRLLKLLIPSSKPPVSHDVGHLGKDIHHNEKHEHDHVGPSLEVLAVHMEANLANLLRFLLITHWSRLWLKTQAEQC